LNPSLFVSFLLLLQLLPQRNKCSAAFQLELLFLSVVGASYGAIPWSTSHYTILLQFIHLCIIISYFINFVQTIESSSSSSSHRFQSSLIRSVVLRQNIHSTAINIYKTNSSRNKTIPTNNQVCAHFNQQQHYNKTFFYIRSSLVSLPLTRRLWGSRRLSIHMYADAHCQS